MSDPAVEAAQREWARTRGRGMLNYFNPDNRLETCLINAAREALAPIRERFEELRAMFDEAPTDVGAGVRLTLAQIGPLAYSADELENP